MRLIAEKYAFREGDTVTDTDGVSKVLGSDYCIKPTETVDQARATVDAMPPATVEAEATPGCYAFVWDGHAVVHANGLVHSSRGLRAV